MVMLCGMSVVIKEPWGEGAPGDSRRRGADPEKDADPLT